MRTDTFTYERAIAQSKLKIKLDWGISLLARLLANGERTSTF